MPNPSKAELFDQLAKACKIRNEIFVHGSTEFIVSADTLTQSVEGNHSGAVLSALNGQRSALSGYIGASKNYIIQIVRKILEIGYSFSVSGINDEQIFSKLREKMTDATETIKSREITRGAVAIGGSNVGEALVFRTTIDENGDDIEASEVGQIKIEVVQDKNFVGIFPGNEKLRIYGDGINKVDNVELNNTVNNAILFSINNKGILVNYDFVGINDSINSVEQPGWRLSSTTAFSKVTQATSPNDIFRYTIKQGTTNNPTGGALRFVDNGSIAQYVAKTQRKLVSGSPYFLVVRWMRKSSCDGTLTANMGSQSESATVSSATNNVWNNLVIGSGTSKGWLKVFDEDWIDTTKSPQISLGVQIKIELSGRTTGEIIIGEVIMATGIYFNGSYVLVVPGESDVDALLGDSYTYSDTYTTGGTYQGVIQETLSKEFGEYLPHVNTAETFSDA